MPSAFHLFKQAERVETTCAALYGLLAARFRGDGDALTLFSRLEAEELQHASRVRLLASAYQHDSKLLAQVSGADELDGCLAAAEEALREVQGGGWGPGLADVRARVAALEDRLAAAHANLLARNGDGALRGFLEQLTLMDAGHAQLLRR